MNLFDIIIARKLAGGGGGSSITVEPLSVTENDTYTAPTGKAYSPVTVNVSGGSSDFSTATLTIIDPNELMESLYVPCVSDGGAEFQYNGDPSEGITVILAEEKAWAEVEAEGVLTLAGNITAEGRRYLITGDCTITIS